MSFGYFRIIIDITPISYSLIGVFNWKDSSFKLIFITIFLLFGHSGLPQQKSLPLPGSILQHLLAPPLYLDYFKNIIHIYVLQNLNFHSFIHIWACRSRSATFHVHQLFNHVPYFQSPHGHLTQYQIWPWKWFILSNSYHNLYNIQFFTPKL